MAATRVGQWQNIELDARLGAAWEEHLLLSQNSDKLIAWADELLQHHAHWQQQRDAFLQSCCTQRAILERDCVAQQHWLNVMSQNLRRSDSVVLQDLRCGAVDAKNALRANQLKVQRQVEDLEEATLRRQRLARCRFERERERLQADEARIERDLRERERREHSRLERERERDEQRRADLELERERLLATLDWEREQRRPRRECSAVQTDLSGAAHYAQASSSTCPGTTLAAGSATICGEAGDDGSGSYEDDFEVSNDESAGDKQESYADDFTGSDVSSSAAAHSLGSDATGSAVASRARSDESKMVSTAGHLAAARAAAKKPAAALRRRTQSISVEESIPEVSSSVPSDEGQKASTTGNPATVHPFAKQPVAGLCQRAQTISSDGSIPEEAISAPSDENVKNQVGGHLAAACPVAKQSATRLRRRTQTLSSEGSISEVSSIASSDTVKTSAVEHPATARHVAKQPPRALRGHEQTIRSQDSIQEHSLPHEGSSIAESFGSENRSIDEESSIPSI